MSGRTWREKPFGKAPSAHVLRDDQQVFGAVVPVGIGDAWLGAIRSHAPRDPMWVGQQRFETESEARAYFERETAEGRAG